jgi:TRAP-type mannitol/chloroaromatic compound transport system permease small subunit
MKALRWISRVIDGLNGFIGLSLRWVAVVLVLLGVINVVGRYLGAHLGMQLSSNAILEAQTQAFNLIFLLGAAWLLLRQGHIRVDILHSRLRQRTREWIDLIGHLLILLPFSLTVVWFSWNYVMRSWSRMEISPNPDGLPLYPIKTVILIGFVLLALQALSEIIKRIDALRGGAGSLEEENPGTKDPELKDDPPTGGAR